MAGKQLLDATIQPPFIPTPHMLVWLNTVIQSDTYVVDEIARISGIAESTYYRWIKQPGFIEWFDNEWNKLLKIHAWQLDIIGMKNAKRDFKYWEAMQKRVGNLRDGKGVFMQANTVIPILGGATNAE